MAYLLDSNIFIQAKNLHYGFDFCPAFWEWLIAGNDAGIVFSIEKVELELSSGADELAEWADQRGAAFFLQPQPSLLSALPRVSSWAMSRNYEPAAINTFLQVADYYLVAYALVGGYTVVTHEIASISTKRIKIPDVCIGMGIKCITPFEMLRRERARFVLDRVRGSGGKP